MSLSYYFLQTRQVYIPGGKSHQELLIAQYNSTACLVVACMVYGSCPDVVKQSLIIQNNYIRISKYVEEWPLAHQFLACFAYQPKSLI